MADLRNGVVVNPKLKGTTGKQIPSTHFIQDGETAESVKEELMDIVIGFVNQVNDMRKIQKEFFQTGKKELVKPATIAERAVDAMIPKVSNTILLYNHISKGAK